MILIKNKKLFIYAMLFFMTVSYSQFYNRETNPSVFFNTWRIRSFAIVRNTVVNILWTWFCQHGYAMNSYDFSLRLVQLLRMFTGCSRSWVTITKEKMILNPNFKGQEIQVFVNLSHILRKIWCFEPSQDQAIFKS